MLNVKCYAEAKLRQINAVTGEIVSETDWQRNLLMTAGLQSLARQSDVSFPAQITTACRVGSGSTSDKIASGAVTFTQVGTTLTASAGFFTAGMVGYIFKWGVGAGGNEVYITAYTDTQNVTVNVSATVAVPDVGTVWNVTRTALESLLYTNTSYQTTAGSCQTTVSGPAVTHKRTYNFAPQVAPYNVNEVGYNQNSAGTAIKGRIVLSSTEVVAPTNFLQVVLNFVVTYSPAAPTAAPNVGTNIDTSGNAMLEFILLYDPFSTMGYVQVNNGLSGTAGDLSSVDGSNTASIRGLIASYSQNGSVQPTATPSVTSLAFGSALTWAYGGSVGLMTLTSNTTISTSGQTLYGVCLCRGGSGFHPIFDVKFTSTYTLPTGSFLPRCVFGVQYSQSLTN